MKDLTLKHALTIVLNLAEIGLNEIDQKIWHTAAIAQIHRYKAKLK